MSEDIRAVAAELLTDLHPPQWHAYPWKHLESDLVRGHANLLLFAYGSLMDPSSARSTLAPEVVSLARPVVAFGVRRVFEYPMGPPWPRYGPPARAEARAALNVRWSGRVEDALNGVLFEVPVEEIGALRAREVGYDLSPLPCVDWPARDGEPFAGYVLRLPEAGGPGLRRPDASLRPHEAYYRTCREGAARWGEEFLRAFLDSTFLGDGVTSVASWEHEALSGARGDGGSAR